MSIIARMADGLTNLVSGLGGRNDARMGRGYCPTILSQTEIAAAYQGSGMLRKVIKIPALDMVREWRDWQAEADQIEAIEAEEERLQIVAKIYQAEILRGLGGGALILGVPGDIAMPVNVGAIGKGGLAFLHVVSRYQLTLGEIVDDPTDPLFGGPRYFMTTTGTGQKRIHPSRVICFKGEPLPAILMANAEDVFWGESRVAGVLDAAMNLDETLASFAALIKDARNIDIGVSKLMEQLSTTEGEAVLMSRLKLMVAGSSIINANLYDLGTGDGKGDAEKIDRHQLTWTGIPEIIRVNAEALSAVADIPMTRLWGKAAEGMNSSGDSQQRDWNKMVAAKQKLELAPCLSQLDAVLVPSALGSKPGDVWAKFAPLTTPTEAEEALRFKTIVEALDGVRNSGAIPDIAYTKGYQNTMIENGFIPGLEGALAELPEDERFGLNPEPVEGEDPNAIVPVEPTAKGGDPAAAPRRRAANDARFNDATPRTLYVRRDVVNVADLKAWAKAQGLPELQDDLHCTIIYSRTPMDWMKIDGEWNSDDKGQVTIPPGGVRIVEPLGDRTAVLLFTSSTLSWRHESIVRAGAEHGYDSYQPHISLTGEDVDLSKVEPYRGAIVLGPEIFEEARSEGA